MKAGGGARIQHLSRLLRHLLDLPPPPAGDLLYWTASRGLISPQNVAIKEEKYRIDGAIWA